ncbi:MAG: UTP--glucose-1-phosphate uridylyltransferase [Verrucomicrobia bacterium]|nr:UTP--glucose-1-phosphate uridylyltransferase [Verrucomicrobiota bacterium]
MLDLIRIITATDADTRNQSLDALCREASLDELSRQCAALDAFRRRRDNLYERVRSLFFLYAIHRFHLPDKLGTRNSELETRGLIPFHGYEHLLNRRFEEAIDHFLSVQHSEGPSDGISSALAAAYQRLAFQTLADQVRRSVRTVKGNQWMFRMGHPTDHPLRLRPELLAKADDGTYPILRERTPVRMDLSHSGWSDIFFLGMDFPEGARVLNVSIDLGVHGRDAEPCPPVEAYLRVIDEPILRLTSVDLGATADIDNLAEVFDFARDYLGLLKAAVIAAGIVPPGIEGSGQNLADLLARVVGQGRGLEMVSNVNNIPKGSRLAVSTNLLASLVSLCMRATGQAKSLTGPLAEDERRLVLARALLGEWLGGSGGGWQDSGGVWPGMKLITGVLAAEGDPEFGVSRGRLMPTHRIFDHRDASPETRQQLQDCLVLVHGGMAQNVGPILEMVTEKYLLRCEAEWKSRLEMMGILDAIIAALRVGDVKRIGELTTRNFFNPIQTIIPWASNDFTETLIARVRAEFGDAFWGFWMLGGMSGGGMGFIFAPGQKAHAQERLQTIMSEIKRALQTALPFAMEPVVYDFAINERGTWADCLHGADALLPQDYYALHVPRWLRADPQTLPGTRRVELDKFSAACRSRPELSGMVQSLFERLLPRLKTDGGKHRSLAELLVQSGFDRVQHEQIREDLKNGRIGLAQNRLPVNADIKDVKPEDVVDATGILVSGAGESPARLWQAGSPALLPSAAPHQARGLDALHRGELAIVTLAAGVGSRWTQGAGVVKGLHPFCKLGGKHRTFIEAHLAKSRRIGKLVGQPLPHIVTTSWLTHEAIEDFLKRHDNYGYPGPLLLSPGRAIGLRLVPMVRDLRFLWEEMPQQVLDEQQQKVRDSLRQALMNWARQTGEGSDYTDNLPSQCLHPVGHWFEIPNLLRNGVLARLLAERPQLKHLMVHNIDTLGADADPAMFGLHLAHGSCLSFEVITRRIDDRGGGLARVNGQVRLVEGLAMPREEEEFTLRYYNSNTCWIDIDQILGAFGLTRAELLDQEKVTAAIRVQAARVPTYITIKDVKKRWGHGQEDVFPVCQFEKLWVDMTALPEIKTSFVVVPRLRGQQLKDQAQLDGWLRDGSAAHVETLCEWE